MKDSYITTLSNIIINLETKYGLKKNNSDGTNYSNLSIMEVKAIVEKDLKTKTKEEIEEINELAGQDIILLAYLVNRIKFYNYVKLDYRYYPLMDSIALILLKYTKASTINREAIYSTSKLIILLDELDKKEVRLRTGLAYKYLRIFIILVMYRSYCNASVVADFIIRQLVR